MNHIYKSIFNKALGVFTAVPEFASAHGKGSERAVVGRVAKGTAGFAASALAISVGLALTSTSAVAGPGIYINDGTDTGCLAIPDAQSPNVGIHGISGGAPVPGLSLLGPSQVVPDKSYYGLDVMKPCLSSTGTAAEERSTQTNRTLFYGGNSYTKGTITDNGAKNLTLGGRLDVNSGIIGVGDRGVNGTDATNSIRMGTGTTLADANKKLNSISIGVDAGASATSSTAIGANAKARADYSVALGDSAVSGDNTVGAANGGGGAIAIGRQSMANNYNAIAIGMSASVSPAAGVTTASDGIAIGSETVVDNYKGIAVGAYSQAKGRQSTVIANNVQGSNYSTASGDRSQVYGAETTVSGNNSVAIGDTNTIASARTYALGNNINVKAGINDALAFGTRASVQVAKSIAMGENATAGMDDGITTPYVKPSVAIGAETKATGKGSVSIGHQAESLGESATALGIQATAPGKGQTSLGLHAGHSETGDQVNQQYGVFIGRYAGGDNQNPKVATEGGNIYGIAIGESAGRYGQGGNRNTAIGEQAGQYVKGSYNIAMGNNAGSGTVAEKLDASETIAIGHNAKGSAAYSTAIGSEAKAKGIDSIAMGLGATVEDAAGFDGIAIGTRAKAKEKGMAVGAYSQANGVESGVFANAVQNKGSTASGRRSSIIGVESTVSGNNSVAIGDTNTVASDRTYAMGNNINVAAGAWDSLAFGTRASVNNSNAIAMGTTASATGTDGAVAIGQNAVSDGKSAITVGYQAYTKGQSALSIGDNAKANGVAAVAIGYSANAQTADNGKDNTPSTNEMTKGVAIGHFAGSDYDGQDNLASVAIGNQAGRFGVGGHNNIAVGSNAGQRVKGSENVAIGSFAGSSEDANPVEVAYTTAVGNQARVKGTYSTAIGVISKAFANSAVALGHDANASHVNSVALGAGSTTADVHTGDYTLNNSYTAKGVPNAANGTVSVGSAGKERQIQNVAAGVISATSTDAINGSQLYATNNYLANFAGDVKTKLGGNAALGNDGHLTMTNIGGTGKDNVNDAIAAANTKVAAGENITVTPTTNADGSKTYTVATKKDLVVDSVKAGDSTLNTDGLTIANGPSITKSGINANGRKVTGVVDGDINATSTDAVNGSQLHATNTKLADVENTANTAVQEIESANPTALSVKKDGTKVTLTPNFIAGDLVDPTTGAVNTPAAGDEGKLVTAGTVAKALAETHFVVDTKATTDGELDGASQADQKIKSGNKVTLQAGKNLKAKQTNGTDGAQVEFSLKDSISLTQVTAGDSTLNTDGLTIAGGPSVTKTGGINAGGKKITGVANGNVAAGSTDAVNGGQLAEVKSKADSAVQNVVSANPTALTATKAGDTVTLTPNFIAGDLVNADGTVNTPAAADEGKLVSAKAVADALKANHFVVDTKGNTETGSEADAKVGSSNKVTFEAGKNLTAKQANTANGGATVKFSLQDDISLNSVTAGAGDNQVVLNDAGVNVGNKNYINKDGLNANGNKVANVKAGDVSATSTDAVNGAQLHNVATSVANVLGGNAAVDGNGNVTSSDIGGTGANTVDDAIKAVNATAAKHTTVVEGKNVKVTKGKNAAGGDEYTVATKDDLDVTSVTAGNTTVNTNGLTITGGPSVTRGGIDAGNRVISGVKAGDVSATSQEAVNGSQLHATNTKLDGVKAKADTAVQDVKSGDENALTAVKDPNTNIVTVTPKLSGNLVDADGNITAPTTPADKGKLVTAGTVADALANTHFVVDTKATDGELDAASQADQKIKAGNKVTLQAGKNLKAKQTNGANGAQVEFSLKDSISLKEVTAGEGANQVVLGNDGVKVGGNTYINKDGLNANSKVISNVADGVNPNDAVNKGQLDAVKGVADSAVKSVDVANGEQNLVVDNTDPKNPKLSLKKDLTVDSVKAGDSTLNNDGLTIAGGPSVKKDGINAGDKTITNVASGAVTPTSKDAVNGGQLYNVANNVKDLIGPDATIDPATGKVTVADPAKGIGETGKGNIGDAIKHVNDAAKAAADTAKKHTTVEQGDNIVVEESLNADGGKHYKVSTARDLNVDSVKAGDTTVNNDGVTINNGPSMTKDGINANNKVISNVADGVNTNDAVNKGQLDAVKGVADSAVKSVNVANGEENLVVDNTDAKNPKLSLKKDLTVDSVKAGDTTVNNDGLTIAGGPSVKKDGIDAADKKITNVAAGDVAENSKDAVNGGQLYDVAKNVADLVGPDAKIDPATGKVTVADPAKGIGETGKGNIGDAIKHVNDAVKAAADTAKKHTTVEQGDNIVVEESLNADGGKHYKVSTAKNLNVDSVKAGDTTVNNDGVTINNGPSMTKDGINANNTKVTNVADGVDAADAVNKGQLDKVDTKVSNVAQNVVNVLGGDATVNGNGDITMSNIGETGKGNINDAIKSVNDLAKKAAAEKTSVKAKDGRSNVTVTEGVNAAGGHEYTVDVERAVTEAGSDQVTVTSKHDADSNTTTYTVDVSDKTKASLAKADSAVQGLTSKDGNLNFNKDPNGNVEVSFNDNLNVKNVTTDRVQVANGPSMSKDGINAAGKAISNVANGNVAADSKDAVNGGQLHETAKSVADVIGGGATVKDGKVVAGQNGIGNTGQNTVHGAIAAINQNTANNFNQIRGDLRKMDRDLRGGIAGALATAGLPQAFRPGKSMVAAAASTYRGQSGLAIGVSRISDNGKVILKVTGNTNSRGDFGGTIGAGYQW